MQVTQRTVDVPLHHVEVSAYRIPTDSPEADGTISWNQTTMVFVEVHAGNHTGIGFTYAGISTAKLIRNLLSDVVTGLDAFAIPLAWRNMRVAVRNIGRPGIASMAIAAVDIALWDLKAKLLDMPLVDLFGAVRTNIPIYGSGGFTSYSIDRLQEQLAGWANQGINRVKMKIGSHPGDDLARVQAARRAIGRDVQLFVDANGAYTRKQALAMAEQFAQQGVVWFEEPVSSDDLEGLRLIRDRGPAGMDIAAGEYGYDANYFRHMLDAQAVDVLQADATRCEGFTGLLQAAALCEARSMPLSAHTAPSIHAHPSCSIIPMQHLEYFYDHARIEQMLFDGVLLPEHGALRPDRTRPGLGLTLKRQDAAKFEVPI